MFAAFRALFKSKLFTGVMFSLLVVAFIGLGIRGSTQGGGSVSNWVIKSGARAVDATEFKRRFDAEKKQLEQQNGPISIEQVALNGLDQQMLHVMAAQESVSALSQKQGIEASDVQVATELRKNTALFNQITGQFDQQAYAQRLAENGMTPAIFEGLLRDDLTNQHLASGMAAGLRAPRILTAWIGAYYLEQRTVSMFVLDPSMVAKPAPPTDAELARFLKANAARFTKPELRVLTVVSFDPAGLQAQAKIDPAELQKRFDFRKESLSKPETRSLLQISAADAGQAAAIAARLAKGEDPIAVAKALNRPITSLADKPKTALPDPKIAETAFSLKDGQSSGPIKATLGYVVIKLLKTTPGVTADFASEKLKIEAEIRNQFAQDKVEEQVQAYDMAHTGGMSMTAAAAKAGVTAVTIGPVTAQGVDGMGKPVPGATPALLKTAFAQTAGADSEIEDAGNGVSYAVRVEKVIPPVLPTVAEIKPLLLQLFDARKTMDAINARADALRERIKKGESIQAVAASAGAKVVTLPTLDRLRAGQDPNVAKTLPRDLIDKMFSVGPGEAFVADAGPPRVIVAHMDSIQPGDIAKVAQVTEAQRPQLTAAIFHDMQAGAQARALKVMKTKTDLAKARNAIGVDADLAAKADGKPAPKT